MELKKLIETEARERGLPENKTVAQIVADLFKRPELGYVPRDYRRERCRA